MHRTLLFLVVLISLWAPLPAAADDGWVFRLTTPRGELIDDGDALFVAIPSGRAWGITSGLLRLPPAGTVISADVDVRDTKVREAFLRVAFYERVVGRPRQVGIQDSPAVGAGERARVRVRLDPPDGAVAYRVRVLGRLAPGSAVSSPAAIAIREMLLEGPVATPRVSRTRLVADREPP